MKTFVWCVLTAWLTGWSIFACSIVGAVGDCKPVSIIGAIGFLFTIIFSIVLGYFVAQEHGGKE